MILELVRKPFSLFKPCFSQVYSPVLINRIEWPPLNPGFLINLTIPAHNIGMDHSLPYSPLTSLLLDDDESEALQNSQSPFSNIVLYFTSRQDIRAAPILHPVEGKQGHISN